MGNKLTAQETFNQFRATAKAQEEEQRRYLAMTPAEREAEEARKQQQSVDGMKKTLENNIRKYGSPFTPF